MRSLVSAAEHCERENFGVLAVCKRECCWVN